MKLFNLIFQYILIISIIIYPSRSFAKKIDFDKSFLAPESLFIENESSYFNIEKLVGFFTKVSSIDFDAISRNKKVNDDTFYIDYISSLLEKHHIGVSAEEIQKILVNSYNILGIILGQEHLIIEDTKKRKFDGNQETNIENVLNRIKEFKVQYVKYKKAIKDSQKSNNWFGKLDKRFESFSKSFGVFIENFDNLKSESEQKDFISEILFWHLQTGGNIKEGITIKETEMEVISGDTIIGLINSIEYTKEDGYELSQSKKIKNILKTNFKMIPFTKGNLNLFHKDWIGNFEKRVDVLREVESKQEEANILIEFLDSLGDINETSSSQTSDSSTDTENANKSKNKNVNNQEEFLSTIKNILGLEKLKDFNGSINDLIKLVSLNDLNDFIDNTNISRKYYEVIEKLKKLRTFYDQKNLMLNRINSIENSVQTAGASMLKNKISILSEKIGAIINGNYGENYIKMAKILLLNCFKEGTSPNYIKQVSKLLYGNDNLFKNLEKIKLNLLGNKYNEGDIHKLQFELFNSNDKGIVFSEAVIAAMEERKVNIAKENILRSNAMKIDLKDGKTSESEAFNIFSSIMNNFGKNNHNLIFNLMVQYKKDQSTPLKGKSNLFFKSTLVSLKSEVTDNENDYMMASLKGKVKRYFNDNIGEQQLLRIITRKTQTLNLDSA